MHDLLDDDHPSAWADDVVMPALLRAAWRSYGSNVRAALAAAGYDDLPRNGAFVVGGMARDASTRDATGAGAADLARQLGVSKQAVSQLLDTLELRGYLDRHPDATDRRRMVIELTERGRAAAEAIEQANTAMDGRVVELIGDDGLRVLRRHLAAVIHVGGSADG